MSCKQAGGTACSSAGGLAVLEPVPLPELHFRSAFCGVAEVRLPNEVLVKVFHLVTAFIPGLLGRSQFLKSDNLTNTSSHVVVL